jgi:hypothetical protein
MRRFLNLIRDYVSGGEGNDRRSSQGKEQESHHRDHLYLPRPRRWGAIALTTHEINVFALEAIANEEPLSYMERAYLRYTMRYCKNVLEIYNAVDTSTGLARVDEQAIPCICDRIRAIQGKADAVLQQYKQKMEQHEPEDVAAS